MRWERKEPAFGDMVRVAQGGIYHFGIYVSGGEVIQFGLPPSARAALRDEEIAVLSADLAAFLDGGAVEVATFDEGEMHYTPEETVARAREKIGTKGYHILYNNCEHFANECATGRRICRQAEDVRAYFRSLPIVDVYLAKLPDAAPTFPIHCTERRAEIEGVTNERVRREKHYVWQLLCYGLQRSLGLRAENLTFTKRQTGGWAADGAYFSLSHSEGALAVAVSRDAVGIDIERVRPHSEGLAARVLTASELAHHATLPAQEKNSHLITCWTGKEALFKKGGIPHYLPQEIETDIPLLKSAAATIGDGSFVWSVATKTPERVRVFDAVNLKNMP